MIFYITRSFNFLWFVTTSLKLIKYGPVYQALKGKGVEQLLIHTGQHYDKSMSDLFFDQLQLPKPDYNLRICNLSHAEMTGIMMSKLEEIFLSENIDGVLVFGDTNSTLAGAVAASKMNIPIVHVEAGLRSYNRKMPEEINRIIVDHISDINLTYSDIARSYLIKEGLNPDQIIKVGSPMYEVIAKHKNKILKSNILDQLSLKAKEYILVSCHREENVDSEINFHMIIDSLNRLASHYKFPIIFSIEACPLKDEPIISYFFSF